MYKMGESWEILYFKYVEHLQPLKIHNNLAFFVFVRNKCVKNVNFGNIKNRFSANIILFYFK